MNELLHIKQNILDKNYNNAIKQIEKILVLNKDNLDAIILLAITYESKNDYIKSIKQYELANKIKKTYFNYNRIALLNIKIKQYEKAIINYQNSLELNSNIPETHNNFGLLLVLKKKEDNALIHFKKAMSLNPEYMDAKYNYLEISEKANKLSIIKNFVNDLTINYPHNKIFLLYKAIILLEQESYKKSKNILENISFIKKDLKWEVKRYHMLGEVNNKLQKFSKAFNYYKKFNDLLINNFYYETFHKEKYLKKINKMIEISKKTNDFNVDNNNNYSLIFLIGFPRSGTTLLDNILSSHSKINVIEEKPLVLNALKTLNNKELIEIDKSNKIDFQKKYLDQLKNIAKKDHLNKEIIIDKMPLNLIYLRTIYRCFPNSKFIFALRHPLDCVLSCYMQHFTFNEAMVTFLDLKKSAILYDKIMELFNNYQEIPKNSIYFIKYEKLLDNFQIETKKLLSFLNLRWEENILNFYESAKSKKRIRTASYKQVTKPLYNISKNKWVNYKKELEEIIPILNRWVDFYKY